MKDKKKSIFLTAPVGMFSSVASAINCARSLQAFLNYNFEKKGIKNCSVMIGISNVDGKKAHYVYQRDGEVGRPKRILQGDIENCHVDPHLHILASGDRAEEISADAINYLIKKSTQNGDEKGKRIWKQYVKSDYEVAIVEYYIEKQSFSILGVNRYIKSSRNDSLDIDNTVIDMYFNDDTTDFEAFSSDEYESQSDLYEYLNDSEDVSGCCFDDVETYEEHELHKNNSMETLEIEYVIADLRIKWRYLQTLKCIDTNDELVCYISYLQDEICQIADAVNKHQLYVYENRIREITLQIEKIGSAIEVQKKAHELFMQGHLNLTSNDTYYFNNN